MFNRIRYKHNAVQTQRCLDKYEELDEIKFLYKAIAKNAENEYIIANAKSHRNTTFNTHIRLGK